MELPLPSGYELRLALKRPQALILVKVIGGQQEGHKQQTTTIYFNEVVFPSVLGLI